MSTSITICGMIVESREIDRFVNATQLCKAGSKKFSNWYQLISTKELIKELAESLGMKKIDLIDIIKSGSNESRGSWVHPQLATCLALWISSIFGVKVSKWVEEWKALKKENHEEYMQALSDITSCKTEQREREIQMRLMEELEAQIEVATPAGFIDLLTDKLIIEVKEISKWKYAVGQVLSYGTFYPDRVKRLVLFGEKVHVDVILEVCGKLDIEVVFDDTCIYSDLAVQ